MRILSWSPRDADRQAGAISRPRIRRPARSGFSLIELLLTVVLVLLLLGAMAFSFSSWQRGAALQEGAEQFAALLHLARAHAAESGRQVHMQFIQDTNDFSGTRTAGVQLAWEPDPLGEPGLYQPLVIRGWDLGQLNDLVVVAQVFNPDTPPAAAEQETLPAAWPSLRFLPDGSSDSAEIHLVAREEPGAARRAVIRLVGLTGAISQGWIEVDESGALVQQAEDGVEPDTQSATDQPIAERDERFLDAAGQTL